MSHRTPHDTVLYHAGRDAFWTGTGWKGDYSKAKALPQAIAKALVRSARTAAEREANGAEPVSTAWTELALALAHATLIVNYGQRDEAIILVAWPHINVTRGTVVSHRRLG